MVSDAWKRRLGWAGLGCELPDGYGRSDLEERSSASRWYAVRHRMYV